MDQNQGNPNDFDELWTPEQMNQLLGEDMDIFQFGNSTSTPTPSYQPSNILGSFSGSSTSVNQSQSATSSQTLPPPHQPQFGSQQNMWIQPQTPSILNQDSMSGSNPSQSSSKKIKDEFSTGFASKMQHDSPAMPSQPLSTPDPFSPSASGLDSKLHNTHLAPHTPSFPPSIFANSSSTNSNSMRQFELQSPALCSPNSDMIQPTGSLGPLDINQARPPYQRLVAVNETARKCVQAFDELERLQSQIMSSNGGSLINQVGQIHREKAQLIQEMVTELLGLMDIFLLPVEIDWLYHLETELELLRMRLGLLEKEFSSILNNQTSPVVGLFIVSQPFPDSVKQNKTADAPIKVQVFKGALVTSFGVAKVLPEVVYSSKNRQKASSASFESTIHDTNESGLAVFNDIKFPSGTRLKAIKLKFSSVVPVIFNGSNFNLQVESNHTQPIVVKTNENQWYEAEGILLKKALFPGQQQNETVSFERFANTFQRRYLIATRQHTQNPGRPLSTYDFKYIQQLRFNRQVRVTEKDFDNFWNWFGPTLHKIRYQRHMGALWCKGYICGFLTRNEVEDVLRNEKPGTFIVRFSEKVGGQFSVSYTAIDSENNKHVRHYLVKNDDIHGAKRTFADFLATFPELETLLQICLDKNNKRLLKRLDKDKILKDFYSKKSDESQSGYIENIQVKEF